MEVERERRRGDRAPIANRSRASIAIRSRVESTSSGKEGVRSKVESNRKEKLERFVYCTCTVLEFHFKICSRVGLSREYHSKGGGEGWGEECYILSHNV